MIKVRIYDRIKSAFKENFHIVLRSYMRNNSEKIIIITKMIRHIYADTEKVKNNFICH